MGSDATKLSKNSEAYVFCEVDCVDDGDFEEEEEEVKSLLPQGGGGGGDHGEDEIVKGQKNVKRKVQWNDDKGNKLVEIREFEPSEESDSEDEDFLDSCICCVM